MQIAIKPFTVHLDIAGVKFYDLGIAFHDHVIDFDQHLVDFAHLFAHGNHTGIEF